MSSEMNLYGLHLSYIKEFEVAHREGRLRPSGYMKGDNERLSDLRHWLTEHPENRVPIYHNRDVTRERMQILRYLSAKFSISPSYETYLGNLTNLPGIAPMKDECRIAVNIPSYREGAGIYGVLAEYIEQTDSTGNRLDPRIWEINIFSDNTKDVPFDNSHEEVLRFIRDFSLRGLPTINFIQVNVAPPFNNVGHARMVVTDLTLLRSLRRENQTKPLYIESEDMDLVNVDRLTLYRAIKALDSKPELDFIKGIEDRNPDIMKKHDYLFFRNRVWDFIMVLLRSREYRNIHDPNFSFGWNRMVSGGWCTAYTAEAYAISGGHDPFSKTGEDTGLGENLSVFRSNNDNSLELDTGQHVTTRSDSSPRRFLYEMVTKENAYAPGNFDDPEVNARIRELTIDELLERTKHLSRLNSENTSMFEKILLKQVVRARGKVPQDKFKGFVSTLFWLLGFKPEDYEYTGDVDAPFKIKNWQNIAECLEDYRQRHPRDRNPGERTKHENK